MVLKPEPIFNAVESFTKENSPTPKVILICPQGERYTKKKQKSLQVKIIYYFFAVIMKAMMNGLENI